MYRREVNERSPMRVFERTMRGGLGAGNVGVVAAGPGVGKTALLVQIALDHLLHDRRVLHISREHAVDHVRAYYSELFTELAAASRLSDAAGVELELERHRLIFSLLSHSATATGSRPGEDEPISKILDVVDFSCKAAEFDPDVIIIDGFDLVHGSQPALEALGALARERSAELWFSASAGSLSDPAGGLPIPLDEFAHLLDVVVFLSPEESAVRLRLLKEHENPNVGELHLRLDSHTMRIIDDDLGPPASRQREARGYRLLSGGSAGAEFEFGACAEQWGLDEVHYSFVGHPRRRRTRGVEVLSEAELRKGDFSLVYVSKRLGREFAEVPSIRKVLQTIWHQIIGARQVFAVGTIQSDGTVRGGTGWGAELARLWRKPLFAFDQRREAWFRWTGQGWELDPAPVITKLVFAGIGTQHLTDAGRMAIRDLFERSFGAPPK